MKVYLLFFPPVLSLIAMAIMVVRLQARLDDAAQLIVKIQAQTRECIEGWDLALQQRDTLATELAVTRRRVEVKP